MPLISNVLEMLRGAAPTLYAEVMEDAEAALDAVFANFEYNMDN